MFGLIGSSSPNVAKYISPDSNYSLNSGVS